MKKTLKVWIEKQGFSIDKDIAFTIDKSTNGTIKNTDNPYKTIEFLLEKEISVKEYQSGFIGKYKNELASYLLRFLQSYGIKNGLTIVIDPSEVQSNETELYEIFRSYCTDNHLDPLLKPTGGSVEFVYEELHSTDVVDLAKQNFTSDPYLISAIDWYNTGLIQTHSTNKFLHFFIPLEILAGRFITEVKTNWKKENPEAYKGIKYFLEKALESKDEDMLQRLMNDLSRFSFPKQLERYFNFLFSEQELVNFWEDDSDITFNGKHQWKTYRLMSKQTTTKDKVHVLSIMKKMYLIRNNIVHKGLQNVSFEEIVVLENILRRVIKKQSEKLAKH